jgi:hypothetical protein
MVRATAAAGFALKMCNYSSLGGGSGCNGMCSLQQLSGSARRGITGDETLGYRE